MSSANAAEDQTISWRIVAIVLLTGLLGVPAVHLNLRNFLSLLNNESASIYWGIGPIVGIFGGLLCRSLISNGVAQYKLLNGYAVVLLISSVLSVFTLGYFSLIPSILFSLANQSMRTMLQVAVYSSAKAAGKARALGYATSTEELGSLVGNLLIATIFVNSLQSFACVLVFFAAIRLLLVFKYKAV